jgi:hypothetical protein
MRVGDQECLQVRWTLIQPRTEAPPDHVGIRSGIEFDEPLYGCIFQIRTWGGTRRHYLANAAINRRTRQLS